MTITRRSARDRIEDLFWIDEHEAGLTDALQRVGVPSDQALRKFCDYYGLGDLYTRLKHRGHACNSHCPPLPAAPEKPTEIAEYPDNLGEGEEGEVVYLTSSSGYYPPRDQRDWVTSHELINESGITYRQCDYWCRTRLIHPIDDATPGSGRLRRFREDQVLRATTIRRLLDVGLSLTVIRDTVDDVVRDGHVRLGEVTITLHTPQPEEAHPA